MFVSLQCIIDTVQHVDTVQSCFFLIARGLSILWLKSANSKNTACKFIDNQ